MAGFQDPPEADARVRIEHAGSRRYVHPGNKTVSAKWVRKIVAGEEGNPAVLGAKYPKNESDMVVLGYLEENYTPTASVSGGDGIDVASGASTIEVSGSGPTTTLTVLDSIDWPYSVQLKDLTLEGGIITAIGTPYEDT